jgi:CPA2 family monovalent cation:H+ antiporter-2
METSIKVLAGAALYFWLAAVLPAEGTARWLLLGSALVAAVALVLLRRRLIYWHSQLEVELQSVIEAPGGQMTATTAPWLQSHTDWNLQVIDCLLPDLADCQGRKVADMELRTRFGCSVVGIERQGFMIPLPPPETVLYPRDRVLLMGTSDQVRAGRKFLGAVSGTPRADSVFEEVNMTALTVPWSSRATGRTLGELSLAQYHGVQIVGIHRGIERILNPGGQETLQSGDEVLALGTPVQISDFKVWLNEPVPPAEGGA